MFHTLGEAAKLTGLSKPTISKAIDDGRLSGRKDEKGWYQIDRSELERVYGEELLKVEGKRQANGQDLQSLTPPSNTPLQGQIATLERLIEEKERTIERLEADKIAITADKDSLARDRDNWRSKYQETKQKLLTFEEQRSTAEQPKRRWWQLGKG